MNTVPQTTDIHESLRHLFYAAGDFDIRAADPVPAMLPEGDALWVDRDCVRVQRPDDLDNFYVIRAYDLATGQQMFTDGAGTPAGWWPEQMGDFDYRRFGRAFPNCYLVNEGYLFVAGGLWLMDGEPNEDGTANYLAWEVTSALMDLASAHKELQEQWLSGHSEAVSKVRPDWADPDLTWVDVCGQGNRAAVDMIVFERTVGTVMIEQSVFVDGDTFRFEGKPVVRVTVPTEDHNAFALDEIAQIGTDLVAAAALLGETITVSALNKTATDAGIPTGALLQMTEG